MDTETTTLACEERDRDLEGRIRNFLGGRSFSGLRDLDVRVSDGTVYLSGKVGSFHEKQIATSCCQRVAGVYDIVNDVGVDDDGPVRRPRH